MSRKRILFTTEQVTELQVAFDQCREGNTKIRLLAVRLYGTGMATKDILSIAGCSRSSLMSWSRTYQQKGVAGLIDKRAGGNSAKLTPHQVERLAKQLACYTPEQLLGEQATSAHFWTVPDLACLLERNYAVVYDSPTSYRTLLKRCGLSRQRPAKQYKSRSELKVLAFEEELEKN